MQAELVDLGRMDYEPCARLQARLLERVAAREVPSTLLLVEHPPVLTLGAAFHEENLLFAQEEYVRRGIEVIATDRGGDVTYHGPNQQVIYPIFRVEDFGRDLHRWIRSLEEAVIRAVASWDLAGERFPPHTGVWVDGRKVAAIGIKVRRWVSMHGIALNCCNDLSPFGWIVPCGIRGHGVTSLTELLGRTVTPEEAKPRIVQALADVFGVEFVETEPEGVLRDPDAEPLR
jgi:lipoyl(octanoyl) transferase